VPTLALALPVVPGQQEAWRRFLQELLDSRVADCAASFQRIGVRFTAAWLVPTPPNGLIVAHLEAADTRQPFAALAASAHPFDRWLRAQLRDLGGLDPTAPLDSLRCEQVFIWPGATAGASPAPQEVSRG
jgi:hypothetical protein